MILLNLLFAWNIFNRHFPACCGTFSTFFGAIPAMFHFCMNLTFVSACLAHFSAKLTKLFCECTANAHDMRGFPAKRRTFNIKLNTMCQHSYFIFVKALCSAMIAGNSAFEQASIHFWNFSWLIFMVLYIFAHKNNSRQSCLQLFFFWSDQ